MGDNQTLLKKWHDECGTYSLTQQMVKHPLFGTIVERGPAILPDVFAIYARDAWIGWAVVLGTITKDRPVLPEGTAEPVARGMVGWNVRKLRDAWVAWGITRGYMAHESANTAEGAAEGR